MPIDVGIVPVHLFNRATASWAEVVTVSDRRLLTSLSTEGDSRSRRQLSVVEVPRKMGGPKPKAPNNGKSPRTRDVAELVTAAHAMNFLSDDALSTLMEAMQGVKGEQSTRRTCRSGPPCLVLAPELPALALAARIKLQLEISTFVNVIIPHMHFIHMTRVACHFGR